MKKILNYSILYLIIGLVSGMYFSELTKAHNFNLYTSLSVVHTHALVLGFIFFLIILLLEKNLKLSDYKQFNSFLIIYNTGLILMLIMLLIKGTTEVLMIRMTSPIIASISGISGVAHILLTIGLILFVINIKKAIK